MVGISLTQPWAALVACGAKRWETRSWPTRYRGPIVIHAAVSQPAWAREFEETPLVTNLMPRHPMARGAILATAFLVDCQRTEVLTADGSIILGSTEWHLGDYSPGRWAFLLRDLQPLSTPIPARGALGLWELPREVEAEVTRQLAGSRS